MKKEIEKIYDNLKNLMDEYRDLPEKLASDNSFWRYIDEHKIIADKKTKIDIDALLIACEIESEKQGFIFGFEYAVRLLTC